MNKKINNDVPADLLLQLRRLVPKRPLTYAESLTVASHQAGRLRQLLGIEGAAMPLDWVAGVPNLELAVVPAYKLKEGTSGLTTKKRNGDYLIAVNRNTSHAHRRFTLAHELKHWLDYPYADTLHARLGLGNRQLHDRLVERVCDHFAAHLLMPTPLVKRAWTHGLQDLQALAGLFKVSSEAMNIRLTNLGLIDTEDRPITTYFRRQTICTSSVELAA